MNSTRGGHSISGPLRQVQQSGSRKRVIEDVGVIEGKVVEATKSSNWIRSHNIEGHQQYVLLR